MFQKKQQSLQKMSNKLANIGKGLMGEVCLDCEKKIAEETEKLKAMDFVNWKKTAVRFSNLLCPECRKKAIEKSKQQFKKGAKC